MSKMGRPRTPSALNKLHGNPGGRRPATNEPEGVGVLWAPPGWFDEAQREQWDYAVEHAPPGLLTGTDREALVVWVVASVEHARATQQVRQMGQVVKTRDGNAIQNPFLPIVNKQASLMLKAGSELGFSPASRASMGNAAPEPLHGTSARRVSHAQGTLGAYLESKPDRLN